MTISIITTSIHVEDQQKALDFYTDVLGFQKKTDVPAGEFRWLTIVGADAPDGVELLLEPNDHPAAKAYMTALVKDGIPAASFGVTDVHAEHERLSGLGVRITQPPTDLGPVTSIMIDDTVGNLIMLASPNA